MKSLTKESLHEIRTWIYRNAREIELSIWKYEFEDGSKEAVLAALSHYQNQDGGFGNTLEPDSWNPNSSPYTTLFAIQLLEDLHITDPSLPIIQGMLNYFQSGASYDKQHGWMFSIPSNNQYPRAPWWTYDPKINEYENIGLTADIVSFLLKYSKPDSDLYQLAFSIAQTLISDLSVDKKLGEMGARGFCSLKDTLIQLDLQDSFDMESFSNMLHQIVNHSIERDSSKWPYYGKRPSDYIASPESEFYKGNEDIVAEELDYLIDTKPENDVWGITWSWFDHNEKFPKEFAISENWWKANKAISALRVLKSFGRII